jgi:uncharacterized membrane protein
MAMSFENFQMLSDQFKQIAELLALVIEAAAVLVVTYGSLEALVLLIGGIRRRDFPEQRRKVWLNFATWILLALEFALAADIVQTVIAPTWDDVGKLAVIAVVRTMLNYFLAKDISSFDSPQLEHPDISEKP